MARTKEQERAIAIAAARRRRAQAQQAQTQERPFVGPSLDDAHPIDWSGPGAWTKGLGEMAMSMGTGMISTPIAEGAAALQSAFTGEDTPEARASIDRTAARAQDFTYQPKSREGQAMQSAVTNAIQAVGIDKLMEWVANPTADPTLRGETGEHAIKALLGVAPFLGSLRKMSAAKAGAMRTTPAAVERAGINLNQSGTKIVDNLSQVAEGARVTEKGTSMPRIREGLQYLEDQAKTRTAALYAQADSLGGNIVAGSTKALKTNTENVLNEFNVYDSTGRVNPGMIAVDRRLADFRETFKRNAQLPISEIEKYRQRILRDARRTTDETERSALQYMRAQLDNWETNEFTKVVSANSRETFEAYLKARDSSRQYVNTFTADQVIDNLINKQNVTNAEMRNFLIGAQKNGLPHAGAVVKRLNAMFGEDSPQMNSLRQDYLYDIVEPLVNIDTYAHRPTGVRAFIRNYENTVSGNPELINALAPYSKTSLEEVYRVAKSLDELDMTDTQLMNRLDPVKIGVRVLAGNQLAKGTARLGLTEMLVRTIINTAKPMRRRLYEHLFGVDPNGTFRKTNIGMRGAVIGNEVQDNNTNDDTQQ